MGWIEYSFIALGFVLAGGLIFVLLIPTGKRRRKKGRKKEPQGEQKDWKLTAVRLEKHIYVLRHKIESQENLLKKKEKQIVLEKAKADKLQERVNQSSHWQKKEQDLFSKQGDELKTLKQEVANIQEAFAKEHGQNLDLQKQVAALKKENKHLFDKQAQARVDVAQLTKKNDQLRQDVIQLKKENAELNKKQDNTAWIAKSEYLALERQLKEKEKQFERLNRELRKELK